MAGFRSSTGLPPSVVERYLSLDPLSVLAMWEPWAILAVAPDPAHGFEPAKRHETRHWTPSRQDFPVVIHATKRMGAEARAAFRSERFSSALRRSGFYPGDPGVLEKAGYSIPGGQRPIPFGALIGLAIVRGIGCADPRERHRAFLLDVAALDPDDRAFGYFKPKPNDPDQRTRFAWRLDHTLMFDEPIPYRGRQDALYPVGDVERRAITAHVDHMLTHSAERTEAGHWRRFDAAARSSRLGGSNG